MGHHEKVKFDPSKEFYKFEGGIKKMCLIFIALGVIGSIWAFFDQHGLNKSSRFWSNLLLNAYYFNGMAIAAVFLIAAHTIGYGGWISSLKRIFEGFGAYIYVSFAIFLLIILGVWFDWHNLYDHWLFAPATDTIVGDKKSFLNKYTFTGLCCLFFILWIVAIRMVRKHSLASDILTDEIAYNQKQKYISAFYIVIFGVSSSVFSWLAVMSLDPHWYSTLFGWYNFASYMCGMLCMAILIITILKSKGHLVYVNESHMHNIVLFLFGFSVFWTYTWFDQFMLQYYANIPEDTMFFVKRFRVPLFKFIFYFTLVINFFVMFLFLIKRSAKRNPWVYGILASILLVGHWLDFYFMVMYEPNAPMHHSAEEHKSAHHSQNNVVLDTKTYAEHADSKIAHSTDSVMMAAASILEAEKNLSKDHANKDHSSSDHNATAGHGHDHPKKKPTMFAPHGGGGVDHFATIGLIEFMMFLGFIGLFFYTILSSLSKERLVPIKTPFLDESLNYKF